MAEMHCTFSKEALGVLDGIVAEVKEEIKACYGEALEEERARSWGLAHQIILNEKYIERLHGVLKMGFDMSKFAAASKRKNTMEFLEGDESGPGLFHYIEEFQTQVIALMAHKVDHRERL